ncbi:MAG: aldose 1-epimerase [Leptospiraceae bacterium]|nr:aldose 1-epimerase [Leptospiraceae bacterium]
MTIREISYKGNNILYFPQENTEYKNSRLLAGIPFLHPWVNRLEKEEIYWGDTYNWKNKRSSIIRYQEGLPIHGLLLKTNRWENIKTNKNKIQAVYNFHHKDELNIFPFPHEINLGYEIEDLKSLNGCELKVKIDVTNLSYEIFPVVFGFHPYFSINGYNRNDLKIHIPESNYWVNDNRKIPTGELKPSLELKELKSLDHVITNFKRKKFILEYPDKFIEIIPEIDMDHMAIFNPPDKDFICIEPMTAPTNAFELYRKGIYRSMKTIQPGQTFQTGYKIRVIYK